ncbi:acyltransferase [Lactococcus lactis]|nr:acyltransferase [Lactococcus lactis]
MNPSIADEIPLSYYCRIRGGNIVARLRGIIRKVGIKKVGAKLKLERSVILRVKKQIILGSNVRIGKAVEVNALSLKGVHIGNNSSITAYSTVKVSWSLSDLGLGIWIGENSSFGEYTFFGGAGGIHLGNDVISGQYVRFHSENHNFKDSSRLIRQQGVTRKGITIGNDVWIGAGSVFLDGSEVGNHCVVAANSVVTSIFPDGVIIGGCPAKVIKKIKK